MNKTKQIFHIISYLQYPILAASFYYYYFFYISLINRQIEWGQLNSMMLFVGISLSFSTLQDPTKTQNKLSRKVWENPRRGKFTIILISIMSLFLIVSGILGLLINNTSIHQEISSGLVVLGIGLVGILKVVLEMFENHRLDKNSSGNESA